MEGSFAFGIFCKFDLLSLEELVQGQIQLAQLVKQRSIVIYHAVQVDILDAGDQREWISHSYLLIRVDSVLFELVHCGWLWVELNEVGCLRWFSHLYYEIRM